MSPKANAKDVIGIARDYFIEGNYSAAEPLLQQAILHDGKNPEIFQMLATIFYDRGQFNKAIKTFQRALEIDPGYTDASVGLSIILNDIGRYEEGKSVFLEAQARLNKKDNIEDPFINEKLSVKHQELADLYFQYNRFEEALEQFFKAQRLSARKSEIGMRVADCYLNLDQATKAIRELRALAREYPENQNIKLKLGVLLFNSGETKAAVEQWEAILLRDPQHPEALKYLRKSEQSMTASI